MLCWNYFFAALLHRHNYYVNILEGDGDHPLLDMAFPDLSTRLQGMVLADYPAKATGLMGNSTLLLWQAKVSVRGASEDKMRGS